MESKRNAIIARTLSRRSPDGLISRLPAGKEIRLLVEPTNCTRKDIP